MGRAGQVGCCERQGMDVEWEALGQGVETLDGVLVPGGEQPGPGPRLPVPRCLPREMAVTLARGIC